MKLTIPPIKIAEEEGFSTSKDIFLRKEFGERLANLVAQSKGELVLAIDAQWGEGKSTFIQMWKGYIYHHRKPKIHSIYFDAFANDYQKDPFLALVAEIYELLKDEPEPKKKEFRKKAGDAVKSMVRGAIKIGVRTGTGGLLDGSEVDAVEEGISKLLGKNVDTVIDDRLESSAKDKLALKSFRDYLEEFAKEHGKGIPIVFIIDELDRCRPDFALELVEQIKHLFSVPGITFLLVLNKEQLVESIKSRYGGDDSNATTYLQKFVNIWLKLPRKYDINNDDGVTYVRHALNSMLDDNEKIKINDAVGLLVELVKYFKPSYRGIERMLSYFALIHNMVEESRMYSSYQFIIAFICYLKSSRSDLFDMIANKKIDSQTLIAKTELTDIDKNTEEYNYICELKNYLIFDLANKEQRENMIKENVVEPNEFGRLHGNMLITVCRWLTEINRNK